MAVIPPIGMAASFSASRASVESQKPDTQAVMKNHLRHMGQVINHKALRYRLIYVAHIHGVPKSATSATSEAKNASGNFALADFRR